MHRSLSRWRAFSAEREKVLKVRNREEYQECQHLGEEWNKEHRGILVFEDGENRGAESLWQHPLWHCFRAGGVHVVGA